jgi:UDP-hydrolysing UDP-N-acetyl-D-glucosamine 2-epimerase
MGKRRVCIVVLTRANYARVKCLLRAVRDHSDLELQLVVGGSALLYRYGRVFDVIARDGFTADATVYCVLDGDTPTTMAKSTGLLVIELATVFEHLQPDIVLTVADHYATMATAIAATYMNIPLAHTQGGEVTGSIDESVRHAVTKLAHLHFPSTARAREWILYLGESPDSVHLVGCPSLDLLTELDPTLPPDVWEAFGGTGPHIDLTSAYIVVLQHPVTTEYGQGLPQIQETLGAVHQLGIPAVWLWPNVDAGADDVSKGLRQFRERAPSAAIRFVRNLPVEDYLRLIWNCQCLVGNSSSGIREAGFLGLPSVNIGTRQQNRERAANVVDVCHEGGQIAQAITQQVTHGAYEPSCLYGDGRSSPRIAHVLATQDLVLQKVLNYVNGIRGD